ncbi:MAG: YcxB family protein [Bacteroidetes bacterium]|nr:YcxB family protein [Bacteroidota bacterium]
MILNENNIEVFSPYTELKIKNEAFVAINEIENYIFLKTNYGGSIVIPKLKISNLENFKKHLKVMMQKYDIKENIELDWKWK